jgi:hypothetical protein
MKTKKNSRNRAKRDRYLDHLSKEENEMLDIMADIIVGYVMRKGDETNEERNRQSESNRHCTDSN